MKKTIGFSILLTAICISLNAQNVGIGTVTPEYLLHVMDSSITSSTGITGNRFILNRPAGASYIDKMDNNDLIFRLGDPLLNRVVFKNGGKVGIGLTNPGNRLDISSDGVADTTETVLGLMSNLSNRPVLQFSEGTAAGPGDGMSIEYDGQGSGGSNRLHIRGVDALRKFTVESGGNVGIGVDDPQVKLHIGDGGVSLVNTSNTRVVAADHDNSERSAFLAVARDESQANIEAQFEAAGSTGKVIMGSATNHPLDIRTNNSSKMWITEAGNVGIGTTAPAYLLEIKSGAWKTGFTGNRLLFYRSDGPSYIDKNDANDLVFRFGDGTPVSKVTFKNDGKVGIGPATPQFQLHVGDGSVNLVNGAPTRVVAADHDNGQRSAFVALARDGSSNNVEAQFEADGEVPRVIIGSATNHDLHFRTNNQDQMIIDSDGLIGIGTTPSVYQLRVKKECCSSAVVSFENDWDPENAPANGLSITAGATTYNGSYQSDFIFFRKVDGGILGRIKQTSSSGIAYITSSDNRLKNKLTATQYGLDALLAIDVYDYCFINDPNHQLTGFLAQQLHSVFPAAVSVGGEDPQTDPWGVDYGMVTPLIVRATQEQQAYIEELEQRVKALETTVSELSEIRREFEELKKLMLASRQANSRRLVAADNL